jgi:hypothetical protein
MAWEIIVLYEQKLHVGVGFRKVRIDFWHLLALFFGCSEFPNDFYFQSPSSSSCHFSQRGSIKKAAFSFLSKRPYLHLQHRIFIPELILEPMNCLSFKGSEEKHSEMCEVKPQSQMYLVA